LILTILGLVIGASCAVLSTLPTLASADPPPNPIWLDIGTLSRPLASVDAAVYETEAVAYVYLVGGKQSDGAASANITLMELRGPGAVGLGMVRPLPTPLYGHAAVVACQRLFVIGGWDGTRWHSEVWSAEIQPGNGALGEWRSEIGYPFPVAFHDAVVVNPDCSTEGNAATIVVIGGQRLTASAAEVEQALAAGQLWTAPDVLVGDAFDAVYSMTNQVYTSSFQTGGTSSSWRAAAAPLPKPLSRHAAAVSGTTIIVTGGYDGDAVQSQVYLALAAGGGVSQWFTSILPHPVEYHQAVVANGRLWLLGGRKNEETDYADVFSAPIFRLPNPMIGAWARHHALPRSQYRLAAFTANIKPGVYVGGGIHEEDDYRAEIYRDVTPGIAALQLSNAPTGVVAIGEAIIYHLEYRNGGAPIENVVITQTIPANTAATTALTVTLGTLEADAAGVVTYIVTVTSNEMVENQGAIIAWSYGGVRHRLASNAAWNEFRLHLLIFKEFTESENSATPPASP
jgi:uncharacterized repeat protein (TIGR01451 family)